MNKHHITNTLHRDQNARAITMTILTDYKLPKSAEKLPDAKEGHFFLAFLASKDPSTSRPWCPDVNAALPVLEKIFTEHDTPTVGFIEVGQKPE